MRGRGRNMAMDLELKFVTAIVERWRRKTRVLSLIPSTYILLNLSDKRAAAEPVSDIIMLSDR